MISYWVYLYPTNNQATIHVSYCRSCNDGYGTKNSKDREENIWRGRFIKPEEALQFAQENAQNVDLCHAPGPDGCAEHWKRIRFKI